MFLLFGCINFRHQLFYFYNNSFHLKNIFQGKRVLMLNSKNGVAVVYLFLYVFCVCFLNGSFSLGVNVLCLCLRRWGKPGFMVVIWSIKKLVFFTSPPTQYHSFFRNWTLHSFSLWSCSLAVWIALRICLWGVPCQLRFLVTLSAGRACSI